jgi:methyl-accepting chemotaxis protein
MDIKDKILKALENLARLNSKIQAASQILKLSDSDLKKYSHLPSYGVPKKATDRKDKAVSMAEFKDRDIMNDIDKAFLKDMLDWISTGDKLANKVFKEGQNEDVQELAEAYMYMSDEISDKIKDIMEMMSEYSSQNPKASQNKNYSNSKVRVGMKVKWVFGSGVATGTIVQLYRRAVKKRIKGSISTRNGTTENPAILIEQDNGDEVLKLASEVNSG